MSTETKHSPTPRPWSVRNHEFYSDMFELSPTRTVSNNACGDPECCGNYEEWTGMSEADAKFAVRAVNAFDDLVARLTERLAECDHAAEPCTRCDADRAALAKAKETP